MDDHTARVFTMARLGFPCAAVVHLVLSVVFYLLGQNALFLFNIGSTLLWPFIVWHLFGCGEIRLPYFSAL